MHANTYFEFLYENTMQYDYYYFIFLRYLIVCNTKKTSFVVFLRVKKIKV